MIRKLYGTVERFKAGEVVLHVGGVGYHIHLSSHTYELLASKEGKDVSLFTHLAVRENALDLYGFINRDELSLFELLIDVPGIGPKSALAILTLATPETLRQSITQGDTTYLTKVSGIGKKTAEKVVLELRDKLSEDDAGPDLRGETDAVAALESLGYSLKESREALRQVPDTITDTSDRIKEALKNLGNNHA